jgi:hypothetical protein
MSQSLPERADARQLRNQAKDLLAALRAGKPEAVTRASAVDPDLKSENAKLTDAQRILAREYGFPSWSKMIAKVEFPAIIEQMKGAIQSGDAAVLEKLLRTKPASRNLVNEPIFSFDSPPLVAIAGRANAPDLIRILTSYGADPNARSKWWAGSFSALDAAKGEAVDLLLKSGAKWDVWSAASHGQIDLLRKLLDNDPSLVNAPGGDGETPLHFASTPEIAELLIERGANLETRDVDHEATPIQYQVNRPEVLRVLLRHGAKADVFTAAALNDPELLRKVLAEDPSATMARVGEPPFVAPQPAGGHIYLYYLGNGKSPHQVAAQRGNTAVLEELGKHSSPGQRLVAAAWMEDGDSVHKLLQEFPIVVAELPPQEANAIAIAASEGRTETVRLLLEAGLDPNRTGMDSGTALHVASWFGYLPVVNLLIGKVGIDLPDTNHGSPPLGWAVHGSRWCRNPKGDYPAVVKALLAAGANVRRDVNSGGSSFLSMAGDREDVKAILKEALR